MVNRLRIPRPPLGHRGALALTLALVATITASSARADGSEAFPLRYAARPLTPVKGLFRLDFTAGGGTIDGKDLAVDLLAGAGYGLSDDFEIGLALIRAVVSPATESGLVEPSVYARYRLDAGALQTAGEASVVVPTDGEVGFGVAAPTLVSIADLVRLDLRPELTVAQTPDWTYEWSVLGTLSVQIIDHWRVFGGTRVVDDLSRRADPTGQIVGGTAITIGAGARPVGDITVQVQGPAFRWSGDASIERDLTTDWFVLVSYQPFIRGALDPSPDPFDDAEPW